MIGCVCGGGVRGGHCSGLDLLLASLMRTKITTPALSSSKPYPLDTRRSRRGRSASDHAPAFCTRVSERDHGGSRSGEPRTTKTRCRPPLPRNSHFSFPFHLSPRPFHPPLPLMARGHTAPPSTQGGSGGPAPAAAAPAAAAAATLITSAPRPPARAPKRRDGDAGECESVCGVTRHSQLCGEGRHGPRGEPSDSLMPLARPHWRDAASPPHRDPDAPTTPAHRRARCLRARRTRNAGWTACASGRGPPLSTPIVFRSHAPSLLPPTHSPTPHAAPAQADGHQTGRGGGTGKSGVCVCAGEASILRRGASSQSKPNADALAPAPPPLHARRVARRA